MKHLLLITAVFLLAMGVFGLSIEGPGAVYITGSSRNVDYTLSNSSDSPVSVNLSVVSPAPAVLSRSAFSVPAHNSIAFSLTIQSRPELENQSYISTIIAQSSDTLATKRIELSFKPSPQPAPIPNSGDDSNKPSIDSNQSATGLFALSFNPNLSAWVSTENLLNGILLIVAAILFIALISRLAKLTR